jgi:hypothetical protein
MYLAFCISANGMHAISNKGAAYHPVGKSGLVGAEADQLVLYSEFLFFEAYNNVLIRMRALDFILDSLFELGVTGLEFRYLIRSNHIVLLKTSSKQQ